MKKIIALVLVVAMSVCLFTACGSSASSGSGASGEKETEKKEVSWEVGEGSAKMWKDSIGASWVQIIVPVVNNGSKNLYLSTGKVDLEDTNGKLVKSCDMVNSYPDIIQPGETGYYYNETTLDGVDVQELKVVPHFDVKESKRDCIRLDISEVSVKNNELLGHVMGISVDGRVENKTSEEQKMVYVSANFFDADKKLIGHAFTIMTDDIAAGDKIGFSMNTLSTLDGLTADNIASYEVIAYPLQMQF